jgi:hypothetical protein
MGGSGGGAVLEPISIASLIHRLDEASGATRSWFFDEPVVAIALTTLPRRSPRG